MITNYYAWGAFFMTRKKRIGLFLITIMSCLVFQPIMVNAELAAFSVKPILPENQIDKGKAFFDLRVLPGREETIEVEIENGSDKEQTIIAEVSPARSNQNGIIDYKKRETAVDKSMAINLAAITKIGKETIVPAKSKQVIPVKLSIPSAPFKGIVLGGLTFTLKEEANKAANGQLENKLAYTIAVKLTESDEIVSTELELGNVKVTQSNLRNIIVASIRNVTPVVVEDLEIEASVFQKNQSVPIYGKKVLGYRMAPNSFIPLEITTNDKPLKAGDYTLKMNVKGVDDAWSWEKAFKIEAEQAKKLNDTAIGLEETSLPMYVVVLIGALIVLVIVIIILSILYYKKNRQSKKNR